MKHRFTQMKQKWIRDLFLEEMHVSKALLPLMTWVFYLSYLWQSVFHLWLHSLLRSSSYFSSLITYLFATPRAGQPAMGGTSSVATPLVASRW